MFSIQVLSPMWWIATFGPSSSLLPVPFMVPAYPGWGGLLCLLTGLIPEQHALVSRHDASTVSSSTETGSLGPLPWLLDNEGQVEQIQVTSHLTPFNHKPTPRHMGMLTHDQQNLSDPRHMSNKRLSRAPDVFSTAM